MGMSDQPWQTDEGRAGLTCGDHVVAAKPVGPCGEGAEVWMEPGRIKPAGQVYAVGMMQTWQKCPKRIALVICGRISSERSPVLTVDISQKA